jgi:hypothetical protein
MSFARFLTHRRKKLIEAQEEDQHAYVGCNEEKSMVPHGDQAYVHHTILASDWRLQGLFPYMDYTCAVKVCSSYHLQILDVQYVLDILLSQIVL